MSLPWARVVTELKSLLDAFMVYVFVIFIFWTMMNDWLTNGDLNDRLIVRTTYDNFFTNDCYNIPKPQVEQLSDNYDDCHDVQWWNFNLHALLQSGYDLFQNCKYLKLIAWNYAWKPMVSKFVPWNAFYKMIHECETVKTKRPAPRTYCQGKPS